MGSAPIGRGWERRLGYVAAAGPIVFFAGWAIAAAAQPGFRVVRDDESALAAIGAAHPWITMVGDTVVGMGFIALAVGLGSALSGRRRTVGCWLLVLAGIAAIVQALVREDCVPDLGLCAAAGRDVATTWRQPVHDTGAGIAFLAILAAAFVLARPLRDRGWEGLARYSTATGGVGLLLLVVDLALSETTTAGLAEFAFLVVPLAWVAVVGVRLARGTEEGEAMSVSSEQPQLHP